MLNDVAAAAEPVPTSRYRVGDRVVEVARGSTLPPEIDHYAVTGQRTLDALCAREFASPLPGFLDPEPVLHALTAEAKVGKTTFAAQLGIAFAAGVAPWPGAPALERSGVLFISAEESLTRVARLHAAIGRGLDVPSEAWLSNVALVARGGLQPEAGLSLLRLEVNASPSVARPSGGTGAAFDLLRRLVNEGRTLEGLAYRFVVLDSASRLWDVDDEANNAAVSRWMDELQRICIEARARILVIHHQGHAKRNRASTAGRGASAFGAAARVNMALAFGDSETARTLAVEGNAIAPTTHRLRITRSDAGHILGVYSLASSLTGEIEAAMPLNKPMSVSGVASAVLRLRGDGSARSSGQLRQRVGAALSRAVSAGAVVTTDNKNAAFVRVAPLGADHPPGVPGGE